MWGGAQGAGQVDHAVGAGGDNLFDPNVLESSVVQARERLEVGAGARPCKSLPAAALPLPAPPGRSLDGCWRQLSPRVKKCVGPYAGEKHVEVVRAVHGGGPLHVVFQPVQTGLLELCGAVMMRLQEVTTPLLAREPLRPF
jgi:hypothetical protein